MIKFTVITVCKNAKDTIRKTVESVLSQTYWNIEYIVQDGASSDGTLKYLQSKSDERLQIYSELDDGIYNAMNRGIGRATGDYVYFLNAGDSIYSPDTLTEVCGLIDDADDKTIYYGKQTVSEKFAHDYINDFSKRSEDEISTLLHGDMPGHQSIFAPIKAIRAHYFNETYQLRADYEWLLNCLSDGYKLKYMPVMISKYDGSGVSSKSGSRKRMDIETQEIIRRFQVYFERSSNDNYYSVKKYRLLSQKYKMLLRVMEKWMMLRQQNVHLSMWFNAHDYRHILIYGAGESGKLLCQELTEQGLNIVGFIDEKANISNEDFVVYKSSDINKIIADIIIVTPVFEFEEIQEMLSFETAIPITSLYEILDEMIFAIQSNQR